MAIASACVAPTAGAAIPAKKTAPIRVLVTNDDGVSADGIDALVEALRTQPKVKLTVVAPATNSSGTDGKTSPEPLGHSDATTKSGYKAVAVNGFPADTITYAFDDLKLKVDLVVSGINQGQNLGPAVDLSGTVGAAKAAAARGVPAIAIGQGLGNPPDYAAGARELIKWFKSHRKALAKAKGKGATEAENLNVPTCLTGKVRGVVNVSIASGGDFVVGADKVSCASTVSNPADDVTAFNNGFATITEVPAG